jgi:rSAM/selenodomain-associated transferase 1
MPPVRLILFAKAPVAGRVKTRLQPLLSADEAAALHTAFVRDTCELLLGVPDASVELCLDDDTEVWSELPVRRSKQGDGDLGERMERALLRVLREGVPQVLIVGADSPGLPLAHLTRLLQSPADAAIGPAEDGGYYAIHFRRAIAGMLRNIRWSTPHARQDTVAALERLGFQVDIGVPWFDVDEPKDLVRLAQLSPLPFHTEQWLSTCRHILRVKAPYAVE